VLALAFSGVFEIPTGAYTGLFVFLVVAGGWLGGFGGIVGENYRIKQFHEDIDAGKHLIMVDTPKQHAPKVKELMTKNHPEADLQGEDSSFNNPFAKKA
jgi:hypothetical protein